MTKGEFLEKLRAALGNDLTGSIIQENVNYYDQYIRDEVNRGRSEAEVIAELGDPWVLAQTIIDTASNKQGQQRNASYEPEKNTYEKESSRMNSTGKSGLWKIILLILGVIGILIVVLTVIGGVISFFAPVLIPILIIMVVIRFLSNRR
ncbi:MAG: DUF1700 domain-containing protein [Lachnospiraceae bacterium]